MPAATTLLTLDQYHAQYEHQHGYEYWFGEVIRKPVPTWLHAIFQAQLAELLYRLGYFSGSELALRIDPTWEPRPDVSASLELEQPYPTKPIDIAIEILSDDQADLLFEKCQHYAALGIPQIFVFDPKARKAWEWSRESLQRIHTLQLGNGSTVEVKDIWTELDRRTNKRS